MSYSVRISPKGHRKYVTSIQPSAKWCAIVLGSHPRDIIGTQHQYNCRQQCATCRPTCNVSPHLWWPQSLVHMLTYVRPTPSHIMLHSVSHRGATELSRNVPTLSKLGAQDHPALCFVAQSLRHITRSIQCIIHCNYLRLVSLTNCCSNCVTYCSTCDMLPQLWWSQSFWYITTYVYPTLLHVTSHLVSCCEPPSHQ